MAIIYILTFLYYSVLTFIQCHNYYNEKFEKYKIKYLVIYVNYIIDIEHEQVNVAMLSFHFVLIQNLLEKTREKYVRHKFLS